MEIGKGGAAEREGTSKEKPWPERMEWAILRMRDSMLDCTEERERSATSRHRKGMERSWRVRVWETEEEEEEAENCFRVSMIAESGFSLFLKGW